MQLILWFGRQEAFNILVTTFHHTVVDITNPDRIGNDESQSHDAHKDIGGS